MSTYDSARRTGPPVEQLFSVLPDGDPSELVTLPGLLRACARRHGDRTAIVEGDRDATFAELLESSARMRDLLVRAGITAGDRVGVHLDNGIGFVTSLFGIARAGGVAVLLNTLWTEAELRSAVARCGAVAVVSRGSDGSPVLGDVRTTPIVHTGLSISDAVVGSEDDAVILYTSGSTGTPKAVVHRHRAPCLQSLRWSGLLGLGPDDVLLSTSPYFWSSGLTKSLGASLVSGATIVAMPRFSSRLALDTIERRRVTALISPPHLDHQIVGDPEFRTRDLSSLRRVHRRSPLKQALGLRAEWNPGGYGLSEMFTLVSSYPATVDRAELDGSDGWVLAGVDVKIVDPDRHTVLPTGTIGRICVRGATLMRGYDGADDPFDEEGFLPTADFGELDAQGRLWFRGRSDSIIRSGGTNLSPAEVEHALQGWHRIHRAAVVPIPHPTRGAALALCVAPADERLTPADIEDHLRRGLAAYKLPRRIVVVDASELRYTATHKVNLSHARRLVIERLARAETDPAWLDLLHRELAQ